MELPIRLIIILFVALAVGGLIIAFSQRILTQAQDDLRDWKNDPANQEKLIELTDVSAENVQVLARDCVRENLGETFDREICFAVFASSFPDWSVLNGDPLPNNYTLDTSAVTGQSGLTAVKIVFDPLGMVYVEP